MAGLATAVRLFMGMATIAGMGDAIGMATGGALEAVIMATTGAAGAEMTRAKMIVADGVETTGGVGAVMAAQVMTRAVAGAGANTVGAMISG